MKNHLLKPRVLRFTLSIFSLVMFLTLISGSTFAQQTIVMGTVYVYETPDDTLSMVAQNGVIKFYKVTPGGNTVLKATATLDAQGNYIATVTGTQDLYAVIFPEDVDVSNYVGSYYPGWLDFESAEPIGTTTGETIDYDWGAVGKEIVERPVGNPFNITGTILTTTPLSADFSPMVYLMSGENVITSAVVAADGSYSLVAPGTGDYEVFTSIPGFASQSKLISTGSINKGDVILNFNLDVYKGEVEAVVNTVTAEKYTLNQNYPNPFNPSTNLSFTIPATGKVNLTVYNSLGKEVVNLINDVMEPGDYNVLFNAHNLSSGIYYYSLKVGNNITTKKMNLVK